MFTGSAILHHLQQLASSEELPKPASKSDSAAFHSLLNTTVLPLVLHSLYSVRLIEYPPLSTVADYIRFEQLPQNWIFVRSLLVPHLPFPTSFYRPAQLRESAQELVTSLHPDWWGLGGETEKEEEMQKKRKKALLDTGVEGLKERREEARKEGKERMKKTFGEGKVCSALRSLPTFESDAVQCRQIVSAAREVFASLETTLASSSTPFFFSSPT